MAQTEKDDALTAEGGRAARNLHGTTRPARGLRYSEARSQQLITSCKLQTRCKEQRANSRPLGQRRKIRTACVVRYLEKGVSFRNMCSTCEAHTTITSLATRPVEEDAEGKGREDDGNSSAQFTPALWTKLKPKVSSCLRTRHKRVSDL